jgi:hypothetical protein
VKGRKLASVVMGLVRLNLGEMRYLGARGSDGKNVDNGSLGAKWISWNMGYESLNPRTHDCRNG